MRFFAGASLLSLIVGAAAAQTVGVTPPARPAAPMALPESPELPLLPAPSADPGLPQILPDAVAPPPQAALAPVVDLAGPVLPAQNLEVPAPVAQAAGSTLHARAEVVERSEGTREVPAVREELAVLDDGLEASPERTLQAAFDGVRFPEGPGALIELDPQGKTIGGLAYQDILNSGVANRGIYRVLREGSPRIIKVLKHPVDDARGRSLLELRAAKLGEVFDAPRVLGAGTVRQFGREYAYVEMEERFPGQDARSFKDVAEEGSDLDWLSRMARPRADGRRPTRDMARLFMEALERGIVPVDADFLVSKDGRVSWIDPFFWEADSSNQFPGKFRSVADEVSDLLFLASRDAQLEKAMAEDLFAELELSRLPPGVKEALSRKLLGDPALVGPWKADQVLGPLRAAAAAALTEKGGGPVTPERVRAWIRGLQSLSRVPIVSWLQAAQGASPAGYDLGQFSVVLGRINARLLARGLPAIKLEEVEVLADADGEVEPEERLKTLGYPNLRELGALHEDGRIQVYGGLAEILDAERLAAVILHEHLARLGYDHRTWVVPAMQQMTEEAFGRRIIHEDLLIMVRRALRGRHEELPLPGKKAPSLREALGWDQEPKAGIFTPASGADLARRAMWALSALWALFLFAFLVAQPPMGMAPWPMVRLALILTGIPVVLWIGSHLLPPVRKALARLEPARRLGVVSYRFDPRSLRLAQIVPVTELDGSETQALVFEDRRNLRVALVPLKEDFPGSDRALVVQWGRQILAGDDDERTFLIFSPQEFQDHPELRPQAVPAALFRSGLFGHFERAAADFLKGAASEQERRAVEAFMEDFRRVLDLKDGDSDEQPVAG